MDWATTTSLSVRVNHPTCNPAPLAAAAVPASAAPAAPAVPAPVAGAIDELYPRRKALWTKMAHRCRKCKKYLIKPAPHPRAYNFEKRSLAMFYLPTPTLSRPNAWQLNQSQKLVVYFTNRAHAPRTIASPPPGL